MIEQKFTNCQGNRFILEFEGERLIEAYSRDHDILGDVANCGLNQYMIDWPNDFHPTMRVIPCVGRDGYHFWLVQEFTTDTIILER